MTAQSSNDRSSSENFSKEGSMPLLSPGRMSPSAPPTAALPGMRWAIRSVRDSCSWFLGVVEGATQFLQFVEQVRDVGVQRHLFPAVGLLHPVYRTYPVGGGGIVGRRSGAGSVRRPVAVADALAVHGPAESRDKVKRSYRGRGGGGAQPR